MRLFVDDTSLFYNLPNKCAVERIQIIVQGVVTPAANLSFIGVKLWGFCPPILIIYLWLCALTAFLTSYADFNVSYEPDNRILLRLIFFSFQLLLSAYITSPSLEDQISADRPVIQLDGLAFQ